MKNFHDVIFPEKIGLFARVKANFSNYYIRCKSGREVRFSSFDRVQNLYDFTECRLSREEFELFYYFFLARCGLKFAFRFKDYADFKVIEQKVLIEEIKEGKIIDLYKRYDDEYKPYCRPIVLARKNTVKIQINDNILTEADFVFQPCCVSLRNEVKEGDDIKLSFEFDIPVRFMSDKFSYNMQHDGSIALVDMELIEVVI